MTRPCAFCERPVPQPYSGTEVFKYCRDNEGACQRAARRVGVHRASPSGLVDHVTRAVAVAEKLEHVIEGLNEALRTNLSPAGVERQIGTVRAEAAASVAAAHAQRDEAREEAEAAQRSEQLARSEIAGAVGTAQESVRAAELARDEAIRERDAALQLAAAANTALAAGAEAEHARQAAEQALARAQREVQEERDRASGALAEQARLQAELAQAQAEVVRLQTDLDHSRTSAGLHNQRLAAAVSVLREEVNRNRAHEREQESVQMALEQRVESLTARLRGAEMERDLARGEVDAARFQAARIDEQVSSLSTALARMRTSQMEPLPMQQPAPAAPPVAPMQSFQPMQPGYGWAVADHKGG